jgi:hypothetical protein
VMLCIMLSCDDDSEPALEGDEVDPWLLADGVCVPLGGLGCALGGSGAGRNRLPIPLARTPGCMPRNGVSKLTVPSILCNRGLPVAGEFGGMRATSAANMPPKLCPSNMTSVLLLSWGFSLINVSMYHVRSSKLTKH